MVLPSPPVDHAQISFFLADHAQKHVHVGATHPHDVASYMIGYLDHCIRDNYLPMAMSTLLPSSRQRKDTSNVPFHDAPPLLCVAATRGHAGICSTTFEMRHASVVPKNVRLPPADSSL